MRFHGRLLVVGEQRLPLRSRLYYQYCYYESARQQWQLLLDGEDDAEGPNN